MRREWLAPLTGILFLVLVIIGFALSGEPPDADSGGQDIIDWYVDNKSSVEASSFVLIGALIVFLFFANFLRNFFLEGTDGGGVATLIVVGAAIFAVGAAIDATIQLALAEANDDLDPAGAQSLQALWDNDFLPLALGIEVFLFSLAGAILRTGTLPRWIGWVAIALGIIGLTPLGFAAFLGAGLLILIISAILTLRARSATAGSPPPAAPQTAP